jgi:hypothetical protein
VGVKKEVRWQAKERRAEARWTELSKMTRGSRASCHAMDMTIGSRGSTCDQILLPQRWNCHDADAGVVTEPATLTAYDAMLACSTPNESFGTIMVDKKGVSLARVAAGTPDRDRRAVDLLAHLRAISTTPGANFCVSDEDNKITTSNKLELCIAR